MVTMSEIAHEDEGAFVLPQHAIPCSPPAYHVEFV